MMKPGEFIEYLKAGDIVRRACWPKGVEIYYNHYTCKIMRVDPRFETCYAGFWEPTTKDLMAEDWEPSTEIYE
jgi:hypothetical protein